MYKEKSQLKLIEINITNYILFSWYNLVEQEKSVQVFMQSQSCISKGKKQVQRNLKLYQFSSVAQ